MIQRYGYYHKDEYGEMPFDDNGEFVTFADAESDKAAALAEKDKEIERLQKIVNGVVHHLANHPLGRARTGEKTVVEIAGIIRHDAEQAEKNPQDWRDMCEKMDMQLRDLLMSAESEWENKRLGHDWAEACESARETLSAYNAMKSGQPASEPMKEDGK